MSVEKLNELGITTIIPTPIILKMADDTHTKQLGKLPQMSVIIAKMEYKFDITIFRTLDPVQPLCGS
jgi:hypothetical protein